MHQDLQMALKDEFAPGQVITDSEALVVYETDATHSSGVPEAVVFPTSAEDVSRAVRWARQHKIPLVARGAGTGLSGGAIAEQGGILLVFSRMGGILELDKTGRSTIAQPGIVHQHLVSQVLKEDLYYPPDPASGRSSTLGGNVGENAGGPHCFKYGVTTNYISGYEFVTADGQILNIGGQAMDYPEYNLACLLTGSEGTLGVITKITARLINPPPAVKTMLVAFRSVEQAGGAVSAMIAAGLVPAAMEMMDQKIAQIVEDFAHPGIPTNAGAILILEVDGYPDSLDAQIEEIVTILKKAGGTDMRIANSAKQREKIWFARKSAIGALARLAPAYLLLDGTVERSRLSEVLEATNRICSDHELQVGYVFHAGDGNLHPLILMNPEDKQQVKGAYQAGREFMQEVLRLGGSITGEHGIGMEKREFLPWMYTSEELEIMKDIKRVFDPDEYLNPGKIFLEGSGIQHALESVSSTKISLVKPFIPRTSEDAARGFAALSQAGCQVHIRGMSQEMPIENAASTHLVCSSEKLTGIKAYAPEDLYITAGAGTTLREIQTHLGVDNGQVALVSPWSETTIGGLIAANLNAPIRMRYGSISDQILAMTIILSDGRSIRAGRPVVKNVAAYDLPKFMVGSYGSLGLITDVTLKITARPRARRTLLIPINDIQQGLELGKQCLKLAFVASAVVLCKGIDFPDAPETEYTLAYTAEGLQEDVEAELMQVKQAIKRTGISPYEVASPTGTDLWKTILAAPTSRLLVRVGVPPKALADFMRCQSQTLQGGSFLCDFASGLLYAASETDKLEQARQWLHLLRSQAIKRSGYAIIQNEHQEWADALAPCGYQPQTIDLMRCLKAALDPAGILSPGIFKSLFDEVD